MSAPSAGTGDAEAHETALRRERDEARRDAARLRSVLDGLPDPVYVVDADTVVQFVNRAFCSELGYAPERIVGRSAVMLLAPDERVDVTRGKQLIAALDGPRRGERGYVTASGQERVFEASVTPWHDETGKGMCVLLRDLASQQAIERMKDEFVSSVSHELRTPLTSIRGALGLLEGGALGALPDDAHELVRIARTSSDRLIRLVNDILDLDRIAAGKVLLRMETLDCERLVGGAIDAVSALAAEHGIAITTRVQPGRVRADGDRATQVLVNLLGNAVKFSPHGGSVEVHVEQRPGCARFSIADRGPGLTRDEIAVLFRRFSQIESYASRRSPGSGLGLALSKAIVEEHGGRIGVTSEKGAGSTFFFELPSADTTASRVRARPRVLMVEDDRMLGRLCKAELEEAGYDVVLATSCEAARAALSTQKPGLLLCDLSLPDGRGETLVELVASMGKGVPVIAMSGEPLAAELAAHPGVHDWLEKPFDGRTLLARVAAILPPPRRRPLALVIEEDPAVRAVLLAQLASVGVEPLTATLDDDVADVALARRPELIVLGIEAPAQGFGVVDRLSRVHLAPLVVYSGAEIPDEAHARLRLGVTRYLTKTRENGDAFLRAVRELLGGTLRSPTT